MKDNPCATHHTSRPSDHCPFLFTRPSARSSVPGPCHLLNAKPPSYLQHDHGTCHQHSLTRPRLHPHMEYLLDAAVVVVEGGQPAVHGSVDERPSVLWLLQTAGSSVSDQWKCHMHDEARRHYAPRWRGRTCHCRGTCLRASRRCTPVYRRGCSWRPAPCARPAPTCPRTPSHTCRGGRTCPARAWSRARTRPRIPGCPSRPSRGPAHASCPASNCPPTPPHGYIERDHKCETAPRLALHPLPSTHLP